MSRRIRRRTGAPGLWRIAFRSLHAINAADISRRADGAVLEAQQQNCNNTPRTARHPANEMHRGPWTRFGDRWRHLLRVGGHGHRERAHSTQQGANPQRRQPLFDKLVVTVFSPRWRKFLKGVWGSGRFPGFCGWWGAVVGMEPDLQRCEKASNR